jgi:hypothetical protein
MTTIPETVGERAAAERRWGNNGAAMAAFLASGVGSFAVGLFVILNELGVLPAPSLYGPAGGVSGRTTMGVAAWLVSWAVLHARWKGRNLGSGWVLTLTLLLIALGLVLCFPPLWAVL